MKILYNKQGLLQNIYYWMGICNSIGYGTNKSRAIDTVNNLIKNTKSNKTNSTDNLKKLLRITLDILQKITGN